MVDIVQLVERQIVDLVVAGSSPVIHPIVATRLLAGLFFIQKSNHRPFSRLLLFPFKAFALWGPHFLSNSIYGWFFRFPFHNKLRWGGPQYNSAFSRVVFYCFVVFLVIF